MCFLQQLWFVTFTEQNQHDVRENVASTETLLQAEHHQERAGAATPVQVRLPEVSFRRPRHHALKNLLFAPRRFMKTPDEIMNGQAERLDHLESDTYEEIYIKEECLGAAADGKHLHEHVTESDDGIYNWSTWNLDALGERFVS